MKTVTIGSRKVGPGEPTFIVAEIGINHNGSLEIARQLIDAAVEAGCDAIKFQKREVPIVYTAEELVARRTVDSSFIHHAVERMRNDRRYEVLPLEALGRLMIDITNTTNGDLKRVLEFNLHEYEVLEIYCKRNGIMWFGSAWDGLSAHFLNGFNAPCHKIASACLTHIDLLRRVRANGKPVILSTGGSTMEQIRKAVEILGQDNLIILHCVATYPCKDEDLNLSVIHTLQAEFPDVPVGYSGHETGTDASLLAVSMGACVVERHITLDKTMPGSDQKASLEPHELVEFVQLTREIESNGRKLNGHVSPNRIEILKGDGVKRVLPAEAEVMKKLRRVTDF